MQVPHGMEYSILENHESISGKEIQADILNKVGDIYVWAGSNKQAYPYYARSS